MDKIVARRPILYTRRVKLCTGPVINATRKGKRSGFTGYGLQVTGYRLQVTGYRLVRSFLVATNSYRTERCCENLTNDIAQIPRSNLQLLATGFSLFL